MTITAPTAVRAHPAHPVHVSGVGVTFPGRHRTSPPKEVLADVELEIETGEIVALIGASGCGKSTLLRQVSGLDRPTTGRVLIDGSAVTGIDPRCAVAFQEPRLLPWRTIGQNVALGLPRGTDKATGAQRVRELLELVGLSECVGYRPRQISGGMAQRASLARALARNPGVLVLDEPFGALDALTRLKMHDLLLEVHAAEPTTILLVTHDVDEALYLADRVVLLGRPDDAPSTAPAGIQTIVKVPGSRPRDRGDSQLAALRARLLDGLGVHSHHHEPDHDHSI